MARSRPGQFEDDSVLGALERAIANAKHLRARDAPAVAAAKKLARKIDAWDQIVAWALEDADEAGGRPMVPANDNVSLSSFLKYLQMLQLVPPEGVLEKAAPAAPVRRDELGAFRNKKRGAAG